MGDASAPRIRFGRAMWPTMIVLLGLVVALAIITMTKWIRTGDAPHIIGGVVGMCVGLGVTIAFVVWWIRRSRPLRIAYEEIRGRYPDSVVFGARLPSVPPDTVSQT